LYLIASALQLIHEDFHGSDREAIEALNFPIVTFKSIFPIGELKVPICINEMNPQTEIKRA
jgi:hypothetical protein